MKPTSLYIPSTDSTINHLQRLLKTDDSLEDCYTVYTFFQTAGRGQAGNSWESEDGKNLLFSTLLRPHNLLATDQFRLSMLVSLAVVNAIETLLRETDTILPADLSIKWPNDIYVGNCKLVGILIENTLLGRQIDKSIAGIGINVNQTIFRSDAPNPVSLKQLTGKNYDLHQFMKIVISEMKNLIPLLYESNELKRLYMNRLYRKDGYFPYIEREVSLAPVSIQQTFADGQFLAKIEDIDSSGRLCLKLQDNTTRYYHFKQVRYVITSK